MDVTNISKYNDSSKSSSIATPIYNSKPSEDLIEIIAKPSREKIKRDIENNENLKAIVDYNEEISNYNKELVSLNKKILTKINSLDDTLSFLNSAFNKKSKFDKEKAIEQTRLLLELAEIIEEKDNSKLEKFINNIGAPLSVGLLVEYLKIKFGLS